MALPIAAFTIDQVAELTGVSESQLRRWDVTGLYHPAHPADNPRSPYSRIYSFEDLVALRTIAMLRDLGFSLPELRKVNRLLRTLSSRPWVEQRFYIDPVGKRIYFSHEDAILAGAPPGQRVMPEIVELHPIEREMRQRVEALRLRTPDQIGRISRHRYVQGGEPVIAGTRIPVASIMAFIDDGYTPEGVTAEYPRLTVADVEAAIRYAREHGWRRAS